MPALGAPWRVIPAGFDATRHRGYANSQRIRKRIEEAFGWIKSVAGMRRIKLRGLPKVDWAFTFATAAYNLVRMRNLALAAP